jgi:predicted small lipoprotein YifL
MKKKHGAFFALVMAVIFTLAGCGGSDSGGDSV